MKSVGKYYILIVVLAFFSLNLAAQNTFTEHDKRVIADFGKRVKEYSNLRERLERQLPKLPKKATPEQIEAHKMALQKLVQAARVGARQGYVFTPEASSLISSTIKAEFKGRDRRDLRQTVFEAQTKGVIAKVNFSYPESKELIEMPPSLLLALPQLPKQLRYRFVGTNLLLVDRENNVIVDYMPNALP
jgi:hypothetical protein